MPFTPLTDEEKQQLQSGQVSASNQILSAPISGQEAFQDEKNDFFSQTGNFLQDQAGPMIGGFMKHAGDAIGRGLQGAGNMAQAFNPLSGQDLGQRAQQFGEGMGQMADASFDGVVRPIGEAVQRIEDSTARAMAPQLTKTVQGIGQMAGAVVPAAQEIFNQAIGMPVDSKRLEQATEDWLYGFPKLASGALGSLYAPIGGVVAELPKPAQLPFQVVGNVINGSKDWLVNVTGTEGTPEGEAIRDSFDLALTVLPGLAKGPLTKLKVKMMDKIGNPPALMSSIDDLDNLPVSPKMAEKNFSTKNLYDTLSQEGFYQDTTAKIASSMAPKIQSFVTRTGDTLDDIARGGSISKMDDLFAASKATQDALFGEASKTMGGAAAITERSVPILEAVAETARASVGKNSLWYTLDDITTKVRDGGAISDVYDAYTQVGKLLEKGDRVVAGNTQFLHKLQNALASDLSTTLRAMGGEMPTMLDTFNGSLGTAKQFVNASMTEKIAEGAGFSSLRSTMPFSRNTMQYIDDVVREQLQQNIMKGMVDRARGDGVVNLKGLFNDMGQFTKDAYFEILDDVNKRDLMQYSNLKNLAFPSMKDIEQGFDDMMKGPRAVAGSVGKIAGPVKREAISKYTGVDYDILKSAHDNPALYRQALNRELNGAQIMKEVVDAMDELTSKKSAAGALRTGLRESTDDIARFDENWFDDLVKKELKVDIDENGNIIKTRNSASLKPSDLKALNDLKKDANFTDFTTQEFLELRDIAGDMSKFSTVVEKSDNLKSFGRSLYSYLNEKGRTQLKGLAESDQSFQSIFDTLNPLKKALTDKEGNIKSTFNEDSVTSLLRNTEKNQAAMKALESKIPDIRPKLEAIRAMNAVEAAMGNKAGQYVHAGLVGGVPGLGAIGAGIVTGNPLLVGGGVGAGLAGLILGNPEVALRLAIRLGEKAKNLQSTGVPPGMMPGFVGTDPFQEQMRGK